MSEHDPLRPTAVSVDPAGIPTELIGLPQWVAWRFELRRNKTTKIPYSPKTGKRASASDPTTWGEFDIATRCQALTGRAYDGIGFVFAGTDPYFGVDLDACRDLVTGELTDWAREIVARIRTYAEVSPSGTGIKLIGRGVLLPQSRHVLKLRNVATYGDKAPEIAVYDRGRYWCLTGQRIDGAPQTCEPCQDQLEWLLGRYLQRARESSRGNRPQNTGSRRGSFGAKFERLLNECAMAAVGERSEHDFALCAHAVCEGIDVEAVWSRVQGVGKFAERGRPYFDQTWQNAEAAANGTMTPSGDLAGTAYTDLRKPVGRTDVANARRLNALHGQDIRYCGTWERFLSWDGRKWSLDHDNQMEGFAKDVADGLWREIRRIGSAGHELNGLAQMNRFALRTADAPGIRRMVSMLTSEPGIPVRPEQLSSNPWLLNCANGTVCLRTGTLQPHSRDDLIMHLCPTEYCSEASCPVWLHTVDSIFGGAADLVGFVQRLLGYALVGTIAENILPIFWGAGSNGKSLMVETVLDVVGPDYAGKAAPGLLMFGSRNSHPTEMADLFGKRLVVASESNLDAKLSEAVVKELTGGDRIKARRMREDFWEFSPSHTLLFVTNHQPQVVGTDHGIWRRLAVVPFTRTYWSRSRGECGPPELEMISDLRERLRAEHSGILRWLVAGCLAWQSQGLSPPVEVMAATQDYRTREDVLAEFLEAVCRFGEGLTVKASVVRGAYQAWCTSSGERPVNSRVFWPELARRGAERRTSNGTWYDGMALQ